MNHALHSILYTPGPFYVTHHEDESDDYYVVSQFSHDVLAEVKVQAFTADGCNQAAANARLLASAPDLLASLRKLLSLINYRPNMLGNSENYQVIIQAYMAVALAEGRNIIALLDK